MSNYEYNAFTGNLDLVGSGASYIDGVVATPASLPTTLGTPALDSVYLAKAGSGVWLVNRRPGGLYCRVANNGNANDWQHLGAFPEVNADGNWELYNSADPTKELKFDLSGLPTATTRTINAPDGNGKMLVEGQSIGATTRNTGAFTTLSANNGTITASAPVLDLSQTWNNAAVTFRGVNWSFVETAAGGSSEVFRISTGAAGTAAIFNIRRDGNATFANGVNVGTIGGTAGITMQGTSVRVGSNGFFAFTNLSGNAYGTADVNLFRDAAATLALRDLANPQAYRIYNTTDAGLTNFERGFLAWSGNAFRIGTEAGGTGSNRNIEFVLGGATRLTLSTSGDLTWGSTGSITLPSAASFTFSGRGGIRATAQGSFRFLGSDGSTFNLLYLGVESASYPALKRSSAILQVRLGDDSAYTTIDANHRLQGTAPATSGATGTAGDIRYDADYIYICTAANTWKRVAIATW